MTRSRLRRIANLVILATLSLSCLTSCSRGSITKELSTSQQKNNNAEGFISVNESNPGEKAEIRNEIVYGKYTIVEFTSPGCGACQIMKPYLEQIHGKRNDIVIRSYDVNRKGAEGIEWDSPLAKQYGLHGLPAFKIFNEKGVMIAEGGEASEQVRRVIQDDVLNAKASK